MIGGDPTPEQAQAGDYPKLLQEWQGLKIAIEHPEGTVREGVDETGKAWRTVFKYAYGEILETTGLDGDPVDVFIGSYPDAPEVYIVQQMKRKQWDVADEQKCMINFASIDEAKAAYISHYDDPRFLGPVTAMPVDEFVAKVRATREKPAMIKALFLKTHVDTYTRKDGVVVQAHEDKRGKHSPEQMAKWAEEKRQREAAQAAQSAKDREAEKEYANRRAASVSSSAFSKDFRPEEIASIQSYYTSGDRHGAQAEGRKAAVDAIERHLRASGVEIDHVSDSQGGKSKSLYVKVGGDIVRVSDHELPMTPERQTNREHGRTGRWSREVIVTDWQSTPLSQYVADIKGELTKSTTPTIIFFKSLVGPYLRGGKIVNVSGYHGRQARAQAHDGQMSLFGGPMSGKPLGPSPLNGKDAVAHTPDMFTDADEHGEMPPARRVMKEPQHTEPTRELIAEHERLMDVLNSPSHADDEEEAKKQGDELEEMKREFAQTQNKQPKPIIFLGQAPTS